MSFSRRRHRTALINEDILSLHAKVIDLSADFRLKDVKVYEEWYKMEHKAPQYIEEAVYGLCEINREKIRGARIVGWNPGLLSDLQHTLYLSARKGAADRSGYDWPVDLREVRHIGAEACGAKTDNLS